jgi:hypothetical protein
MLTKQSALGEEGEEEAAGAHQQHVQCSWYDAYTRHANAQQYRQ